MSKDKIIIIGGSTGSGKSDIAIEIAKAIDGEIISCDSMQIYRGMDIGTAKVTVEEMQGIPHHMIDIVDPKDNFSVSEYADMTREIIKDILNRKKMPIIVGGTGLYVDALIYDFDFNNADVDMEYREYLNELALKKGNEYVHNMLVEIDSIEASKIHPNNVKRVIRALEIYKTTGNIKSQNDKKLHYDTLMFIVDTDREVLYDRINKRVDIMMEKGLLDEIKLLIQSGLTFDMQSMKAIGYREFEPYFAGNCTIDEVIDKIKQDSRNYAKRQVTWFHNKYKDIANMIRREDILEAIDLATKFSNN